MRPIGTGALGFGLVNIPVRLYGATDESTIPFVSLDRHDHARIRYKKVNEQTGKEESLTPAEPVSCISQWYVTGRIAFTVTGPGF